MRVELLVIINNEPYLLDTFENIGMALNYNIADINDITSKNSSYSKTISLPDSKNNRIAFGYICGLDSNSSFNPNKKVRCYILKDTVIQFEGDLQLQQITYDKKINRDTYDCVVYASTKTLSLSIGEKLLYDLNFNGLSIRYTYDDIVNSWTASYTNIYYFPLMDIGNNFNYNYVSNHGMSYSDFKPSIYIKPIFDQIILEAGYNYTSDFLNGDLFKSLVIPFCNDVVLPSLFGVTYSFFEINGQFPNICSIGSLTTRTTYITASYPPYQISWSCMLSEYPLYDPNNYYYPATFKYTAGDSTMANRIRIDYNLFLTKGTGAGSAPWSDNIYDDVLFYVKRSMNSTGSVVPGWDYTPTIFDLEPESAGGWPDVFFNNGLDTYYSVRTYNDNPVDTGGGIYSISGTFYTDWLINNPLRPGEEVRVFFLRSYSWSDSITRLVYQRFIVEVDPNQYCYGCYLNLNKLIPNSIKQKDFLFSIAKMFNLYFEPNKYNITNLIIEPRDHYIEKYKIKKDWSDKLDVSQQIISEITSNTQKKTNIFTYVTDSDMYNAHYALMSQNIRVYGDYWYDIDSDFIIDINTISPIFAPTILDKLWGSNEMYLPIIVNNDANRSAPSSIKPRIDIVAAKELSSEILKLNNGSTHSIYPYIGPFDDPKNPTISINWGQVDSYYIWYGDTVYNLFYNYYQDQMDELSNQDSRIVTAYFWLNATDISQFGFGDEILLKFGNTEGTYRVNKIIDYDPTAHKSTKIELIKII